MPEGRAEDSAEPLVRVGRRLVPFRLYAGEVIVRAAVWVARLRGLAAIPAAALILLACRFQFGAFAAACGALTIRSVEGLSHRSAKARWLNWDLSLAVAVGTLYCVVRDPFLLRGSPWTWALGWPLVVEPLFLLFALGPPSRGRVFRPVYQFVPLARVSKQSPGDEGRLVRTAATTIIAISTLVNMALMFFGAIALSFLLLFGLGGRIG